MRPSILILFFCILQFTTIAQRRQDIRFDIDTNRAIFAGYENKLTVKSGATVSSESVSITRVNDTLYIIRASVSQVGKKAKITVTKNGKSTTRSFNCKRFPNPLFYIGNIVIQDKDKISSEKLAKEISDGFWIGIKGDGSEFNDNYDIISLKVTITKNGKSKEFSITGEAATSELKTAFSNLKGAKIKISEIRVGSDAGTMFSMNYEIEGI